MNQIIPLELSFSYEGTQKSLFPTLICHDQDLILVDCGYPGFLPLLGDAIRQAGFSPDALTHVVITHHDDDHMGALAELLDACPQVQVLAGAEQVPYISGQKKSLRLQQAEALQATLPQSMQAWGLAFQQQLAAVKPARVDRPLSPGDTLPWCGGCQVLATPGHMPGHISFYFPQVRTVITGDAAVVENGALTVANPQFTLDMDAAQASLSMLLNLPADTYFCFHGGTFHRSL